MSLGDDVLDEHGLRRCKPYAFLGSSACHATRHNRHAHISAMPTSRRAIAHLDLGLLVLSTTPAAGIADGASRCKKKHLSPNLHEPFFQKEHTPLRFKSHVSSVLHFPSSNTDKLSFAEEEKMIFRGRPLQRLSVK